MNTFTMEKLNQSKLNSLINSKSDFLITEVSNLGYAVKQLEKAIEGKGMSCRVYTKGRSAAIAAAAIPTPVTVIGGWLSGIGIAAHNLATLNPDYEIAKNKISGEITVSYQN